jgi:hypothetical protein
LIQIENHSSPEKNKGEDLKSVKSLFVFFFVLWVSGRVLFAPSVYFEKRMGEEEEEEEKTGARAI